MQQKICVEPKLFWMKRFTIVLLLLIYPADSRAQSTIGNWFTDNLVEGDTLYISFSVASGEMASSHQGLLVYRLGSEVFAKFVLYKYGASLSNGLIKINPSTEPINFESVHLITFFHKLKSQYVVIRPDWKLDSDQKKYLDSFFIRLLAYEPKGYSNAPEYYLVMNQKKTLVVIDPTGALKMHVELRRIMGVI